MTRAMRCTLAAGLLWLTACAGPQHVSLAQPPSAPTSKQYLPMLERWTRRGDVRADFDETLIVAATFRSPEFREAFASHWIDVFRLLPSEAPTARDNITSDGAEFYEFHLETSTHRWELNDISSVRSTWRLALQADHQRAVVASSIEHSKARRELDVGFYPYANEFTRGWRVRFPKTLADGTPLIDGGTQLVTLRISGPAGSVDLDWLITP